MATTVYLLCALTSFGCAVLLSRSWLRSRARLVLWTGLCFIGLALNNLLLVLDRTVLADRDLLVLRDLTGFIGVSVLLFGLIWESR